MWIAFHWASGLPGRESVYYEDLWERICGKVAMKLWWALREVDRQEDRPMTDVD